jgi:HAD superfamily hydrolase (TIGR01549 family)
VALAWELEESAAGFDQLHQRLLAAYDEQLDDTHSILYPGMPALLDWLEATEIPWGIVTNKPLQYSNKLLSNMALLERCPVLVCPDHVSRRKPDPESLHLACHQLDCASEHGIYVGDHLCDIEAGRAAGMFTIAAAYGYLPPAPAIAQWQADHIVNSATDILHWIQSQTRTTA